MFKSDLAENPLNDAPTKESYHFDHTSLDAETLAMMQRCTSMVRSLIKPRAKDVIAAGETLLAVKCRLGRGRFGPWLESEFGKSSRTAQKFMRVAVVFKNEDSSDFFKNEESSFLDIDTSALCHLTEDSTPKEARQEAIDRACHGERITHTKAKAIVNQYKPASANPKLKNTVQSASHQSLPHLHLAASRSASSFSPVVIDIPAETISVQEPALPSSQEQERLPQQQCFSITTDNSRESDKRQSRDRTYGLTRQIQALTPREPALCKLPKEPLSAQLHLSKVDWHVPRLLNNAQTLQIPLCLCVDGPSYVLPNLLKQIRENPDIKDLMSNELNNLIKVVAELVAL